VRFMLGYGLLVIFLLLACGCDPEEEDGREEPPAPPRPFSEIQTSGGPKLAPPPLLSEQATQLPASGYEGRKGLESLDWLLADFGNPGQTLHVDLGGNQKLPKGCSRLAIEMFGGPKHATALRCEGAWALLVDQKAETVLVIYNGSPASLQGSLAFTVSARYIWFESPSFELNPGWNTVRIKQGASDFKASHTNWEHTAPLWRPGRCYCITLLVHNGQRSARVFIDYISIAGTVIDPPPGALQAPK